VIETRPGPIRRRVARSTGGGKTGCRMGGSVGPGVIRLMAGVAIRGHCRVVVIRVAARAGNRSMSAGQREDRRVIES